MSTASYEEEVGLQAFEAETGAEEDASALEPHYGCSPAFDINILGRNVLPPGTAIIKRLNLVEFGNLTERVPVEREDGGAAFPADTDANQRMRTRTKTARACAEELRFAYGDNNPWGFQVFECLTGLDRHAAFDIFRTVVPRPMNLPELISHLEDVAPVAIAGAGSYECAEKVREQLLRGAYEAAAFSRETLDGSAQEIADRKAGSQGKAKYDRRDQMLATALGEKLEGQPLPQPAAPTEPQLPASVLDLVARQSEAIGRLTATVEELQRERPVARAKRTAEPVAEA